MTREEVRQMIRDELEIELELDRRGALTVTMRLDGELLSQDWVVLPGGDNDN